MPRTKRSNPPSSAWQLQDAKARFSELFRLARSRGPQWVTRHGKESVVIIPGEQFRALTSGARQPRSLVQFFARSPLAHAGLRLDRRKEYGRAVDL